MATSIGLRATPSRVYYAIVTDEDDAVLVRDVAYVNLPVALGTPDQLRFARTTLLDIMDEYGATRAGIRLTEPFAQQKNVPRLNLEGVIQELLSSSPVERYFAGAIAQIARYLEEDRTRIKAYVNGEETYQGLGEWDGYSTEERESVLVAFAALSPELAS